MSAVVTTPEQADRIARNDDDRLITIIGRIASDPSVDVAKFERLLAMQERIHDRTSKAAYSAALAAMQPELPIIAERGGIKDKGGNVQSRYALWEDIVGIITPILSRHGFALSFRTGNDANGITVTGVLSHREGHSEQTSLTLPIDTSGNKNAVQSVGSSTSYGKRYVSGALLNLRYGETDDDGRAGGGPALLDEGQVANLEALITEIGADKRGFLRYIKAPSLDQIAASSYVACVKLLEAKRAQQEVRS